MTIPTENSNAVNVDVVLADIVPWGLCMIDQELVVHQWNRTLELWTGISRSAAIGMNLGESYPQLVEPRIQERLSNVFQAGHTAIFSAALHKQFIPVLPSQTTSGVSMVQRTVVRPIDHTKRLALIMIEDVTAQFRQVEQLRKERDGLKRVVSSYSPSWWEGCAHRPVFNRTNPRYLVEFDELYAFTVHPRCYPIRWPPK